MTYFTAEDGETFEDFAIKNTSILGSFLNVFYFINIVPFKTAVDATSISKKYILRNNALQRVICGFIHSIVLTLFTYLSIGGAFSLMYTPVSNSSIVVSILEWISNVSSLFIGVATVNILWRKQTYILEIIQTSHIKTNAKDSSLKKFCININHLVTVFTTVIVLILMAGLSSAIWMGDTENYRDLRRFLKFHRDLSRYGSFFNVTLYIICGYAALLFILGEGIIICTTLELGRYIMWIKQQTETIPLLSIRNGVRIYKRLEWLSDLVRDHIGGILLPACIASVSYYAQTPHVLNGHRGNSEKLVLGIFGVTIPGWILAAELHSRAHDTMTVWIKGHIQTDILSRSDLLRLMAVSQQLSIRPVAMSCKYFSITYSYLTSMLGAVLTYGLIIFQLNNDAHNCNCKAYCNTTVG